MIKAELFWESTKMKLAFPLLLFGFLGSIAALVYGYLVSFSNLLTIPVLVFGAGIILSGLATLGHMKYMFMPTTRPDSEKKAVEDNSDSESEEVETNKDS